MNEKAMGAEALKVLQQVRTTEHAPLHGANATVTTEIQAIRIGDLTLIGLPGEVFGIGSKDFKTSPRSISAHPL